MILRQILILIISALVLFFGYDYYKNDFCPGCCVPGAAIGQAAVAAGGPLVFNWSDAGPITRKGFGDIKRAILAGSTKDNALTITGHYFADEENTSEYENLGLARAAALGEILLAENPKLKIITKHQVVEMIPGSKSQEFESVTYAWGSGDALKNETVEVSASGEAKILFPFNSSNKIDSPEVEAYLNSLAKRLKNNADETVKIMGYTDSLGEPGANRRLSERRAKKIRDILKSKGVNRKQIKTGGRGESDAVAPNNSEASRQLNRRVEITIE